jgi:hypothetical protein
VKRFVLIIAGLAAAIFILLAIAIVPFFWVLVRPIPPPPQPEFGFTGDWRSTHVFGFEERPLPPPGQVWQDYSEWQAGHKGRYYLARLGGAAHQSDFRASTNRGETPMGAQTYTHVDFIYTDPTNGSYHLYWSLPGQHDPRFLRFDDHYRLYQLEPWGNKDDLPPQLTIQGIEGIKPEHYDPGQDVRSPQDGATNRNRPIRSDTNSTPSAAGSRR